MHPRYYPPTVDLRLPRPRGVSFALRRGGRDETLVLCYHAVGDLAAGAFVLPQELDWQLGLLVKRGYRPATFTSAVTGTARGRVLAVSFDDGHASVLGKAFPIVAKHGLVGTVFPRLDALGHEGSLTVADLAFLLAEGWEVGSHTLTHPRLTTLSDAALRHELTESKRELERRLAVPCRSIAYPQGDADARVIAAAVAAGYEAGAAVSGVPVEHGPFAWSRIGVHGREGRLLFRVRVSRLFRAVRSSTHVTRLIRAFAAWGVAVRALPGQRVQR